MAKKALIHNGIVQQIEESSNTFEVHSNLKWVDCDDSVKVNWTYNGSTFADDDTRTTSEKTAAQWEHVRIERKKLLENYLNSDFAFSLSSSIFFLISSSEIL